LKTVRNEEEQQLQNQVIELKKKISNYQKLGVMGGIILVVATTIAYFFGKDSGQKKLPRTLYKSPTSRPTLPN
jgi:hypothetical protein